MSGLQARFTRSGYERLKHELEHLKSQRSEVRRDIKEAREQGDLRENHAYHQAKEAQGILEARIHNLETRLADAIVVEEDQASDEVIMGMTVRVRQVQPNTGREVQYTVVSVEEVSMVQNGVSDESPIGKALLGRKVGDQFELVGPQGPVRFEVLELSS